MKNKVMRGALNVMASVKCESCGGVHDADGKSFLTIFGDITVGAKEATGKSNFDEKGKLVSSSIRCRTLECNEDIAKLLNMTPTAKKR